MTRTLRTDLERWGRKLLVLALVALLAVPIVQAANRLRLHVDGDTLSVLTYEATVAEVLDTQGVELAAGDRVLPSPDTPVDQVDTITVLRTIEVELVVDGASVVHRGTWRSVEGLLDAIGLRVSASQVLRPGRRAPLSNGDVVTIDSPTSVTLTADGTIEHLHTHLGTVGELLDNAGLEVGEADILVPGRETELADGMDIVVQRVGFTDVVEQVAIPFDEETRSTDELFVGASRVAQAGVEGVREDTYRVTIIDGEHTERELISQVVVSEPVTRIVEHGTVPRPSQQYIDDGSIWYDLAHCESGLRWDFDGTYDGGLQFHPETWTRNKLAGYPKFAWMATPQQQIEVGKIIQRRSGWGAWPSCARKLGLI